MTPSHDERLENLFTFAHDTLGYSKLTELHVSWFDALLKHKYLLMLAPPKHFKSTVCTISYAMFRLAEDHNMRILIVNEVLDNSKLFLREIKEQLRINQKFRRKYGEWDTFADQWTEERLLIPRSEIRKEPSIAVASVLGTVVSIHPNLILVDDPCSNRNTQTPHQRQKVMNWFQRDLLPRLDHGGQIIVVMTRWHSEDLAGWIMSNPGYADWKIINLAAEWTDESNKHHILFPEIFTKEDLEKEKARLGTANYNCLWLNDPSGQEGAEFKASWLDSGRYDKRPDELTIYAGIDPAISRKEGNSNFAYCVIGRDKASNLYVLDAAREQIRFHQQLSTVKRLKRVHDPCIIVIETNAYQAAFVESLLLDEETRRLPLKPENTTQDKHARIRGLAPLFESGQIRLPRSNEIWVTQLEEELLQFPHGKDDMLDALYLAIRGVDLQRMEQKIWFTDETDEDIVGPKRTTRRPDSGMAAANAV